jgi:nucleoside-diphosphate-sugar epimerase
MRVVVCGAGGYLGIPVCQRLAEAGHYVIAVDRYYFGKVPKGVAMSVYADIREIDAAIFDKIDAVVDLAGMSNDASCEIDFDLANDINVKGGCVLAELAHESGVKRYVYASSCAVYGDGGDELLTEGSPVNPLSNYANGKVEVEKAIRNFWEWDDAVILRFATLFGVAPRMRFDLAVNVMTARAWKEGSIYVMGGGGQWRPFLHVNNAADVIVDALDRVPPGTYNVGYTSQNFRIAELATMVRKEIAATRHNIPDDPDRRSYRVSFEKIAQFMDLARQVTVRQGIIEILAALDAGTIDPADPSTNTLGWYKQIIEWERRIEGLRINGRVL